MVPQERLKPRPLYLKSSTLLLVDSTGIIQYAMSRSHLKLMVIMNQLWAWLDSDPKAD